MKPSLAKGTRDFTATEIINRRFIINKLQNNFELFGFQPLETPSFENLSTLTGKYGEEGDRLIFKILNSGDFLRNHQTLISSYTESVLMFVMDYLLEELKGNNSDFDITIKKILSEDFIEETINIISGNIDKNVNNIPTSTYIKKIEDHFYDNRIKSFYDKNLFSAIKSTINLLHTSKVIQKILNDLLTECSVCSPKDSLTVINLVTGLTNEIIGSYFRKTASTKFTQQISDKALRYDLTVPFARFVAMNHGQLNFPYKRYQIQPVWRADRPQKGRFREFYQCDADVVGSESLWQEVELVQLYNKAFSELGVPVTIHINNRKILSGLADFADISDKLIDFTVALDKLDKIGKEGVTKEMLEKGIAQEAINKVDFLFNKNLTISEIIEILKTNFETSEVGKKGVEELEFVINTCQSLGIDNLVFDITLARGLDYYTGAIFEVKAQGVEMGSIGGGGRYDNLTEVFGVKNIPGIGISFGLDRIYLVMEELGLFPENASKNPQYLFANYGDTEATEALKLVSKLREKGIPAELYPENAKLKKQFTYAEKKGIPEIVFIGEAEIANGSVTIKNLTTGEQRTLPQAEFLG